MKTIKIVIYILIGFIFFLVLGAFFCWPLLRVDERLQTLIHKKAEAAFPGSLKCERVHLGWDALYLYEVTIRDAEDRLSLTIDQTIVRYNLWRLLVSGLNVSAAISEIVLDHPDLSYRFAKGDSTTTETTADSLNLNWQAFDALPKELWGKTFYLHSGSLVLWSPQGDPLTSLSNLDLQLKSPRWGEVKGKLHSGTQDGITPLSNVLFELDRRQERLETDLEVKINFLHLGQNFNLPDSLSLDLEGIDLKLLYWMIGAKTNLNGEIHLQKLRVERAGQELLTTEPFLASIENWNVRLDQVKARGLTGDWVLDGQMLNLLNPTLDFHVTATSDEISPLNAWLPNSSPVRLSGTMGLEATIQGAVSRPEISLQASVQHLEVGGFGFDNLQMETEWSDKRLIVNRLDTKTEGGRLTLQGQVVLAKSNSALQVELQYHGAIPRLPNSRRGVLKGFIHGSGGDYDCTLDWFPELEQAPPVHLQAAYSAKRDHLEATASISDREAFIHCSARQLSTNPNWHISFHNPQIILAEAMTLKVNSELRDFDSDGELQGTQDALACQITTLDKKSALQLTLDGTLGFDALPAGYYKGNLLLRKGAGLPLEGQIEVTWSSEEIALESLRIDQNITATGGLNLQTGELAPTEVRFQEWPITRGLQFASSDIAQYVAGNLNARVELYGRLDDLIADMRLYFHGGKYFEQTDFWAKIDATLEQDQLQVSDCSIGRGIIRLVNLKGQTDLNSQTLAFQMQTRLSDVHDVLQIFGGNPYRLYGPLQIQATLEGTVQNPKLAAEVHIGPGRLYQVPYDYIKGTVALDSVTGGALTIKNLELFQYPDLNLTAQGTLPLRGHPLDLHAKLSGNLLRILHQIEDDILESRGEGELNVHIIEERGKVKLHSADLQLQQGFLKLPSVVQTITDLQARAQLTGGRLTIEQLTGNIEDQGFLIQTTFDSSAAHHLSHLRFAGGEIDAGILQVRTSGTGIRAHLPALTASQNLSDVHLRGRNGSDYFLIGGPINRPVFHGRIEISNADIVFPFEQTGGSPSQFVQEVLTVLASAYWDLEVIPQRDNHYVREERIDTKKTLLESVRDLFSAVWMNLTIDPGDSHLRIFGCLNEGSFALQGDLVSTRGNVEILDQNFRVDRFEAEFDGIELLPWVQGRASTVYVDSLGISRNIYATMYVVDSTSGESMERGRWGDILFKLEDDFGNSQEQILAAMGFSPGTVQEKMTTLSGTILSNTLTRSFIRPVERGLESLLGIDVIRLQPTIAHNLFESQILGIQTDLGPTPQSQLVWGAYFLRQSQLTVGKYLSDDLLIYYSGIWKTGIDAENVRHFGFLNRWTIDYRIRPVSGYLVLSLGYEYDSLEKLDDKEISLRYSFVF